jgi:hypothetical protein
MIMQSSEILHANQHGEGTDSKARPILQDCGAKAPANRHLCFAGKQFPLHALVTILGRMQLAQGAGSGGQE